VLSRHPASNDAIARMGVPVCGGSGEGYTLSLQNNKLDLKYATWAGKKRPCRAFFPVHLAGLNAILCAFCRSVCLVLTVLRTVGRFIVCMVNFGLILCLRF